LHSPPQLSACYTTPTPEPLSLTQYHTTLDASSEVQERSESPELISKNYTKHGFFRHHSPKSLSITPYNTTLDNSMSSPAPNSSSSRNSIHSDVLLTELSSTVEPAHPLTQVNTGSRVSERHFNRGGVQSGNISSGVNGHVHRNTTVMDSTTHNVPNDISFNSSSQNWNLLDLDGVCEDKNQGQFMSAFLVPPRGSQNFNPLPYQSHLRNLAPPSLDVTTSTVDGQVEEEDRDFDMPVGGYLSAQHVNTVAQSLPTHHSSSLPKVEGQPLQETLWHPLHSSYTSMFSPTKEPRESEVEESTKRSSSRPGEGLASPEFSRLGSWVSEHSVDPDHSPASSYRSAPSPNSDDESHRMTPLPGEPSHNILLDDLEQSTIPGSSLAVSNGTSLVTSRYLPVSVVVSEDQQQSQSQHQSGISSHRLTLLALPSSRTGESPLHEATDNDVEENKRSTLVKDSSRGPDLNSTNNSISMASYHTNEDYSKGLLSSGFSGLEFPGIALPHPTLPQKPCIP